MRYVLAALGFLLNADLAVADTLLLRSGDHTGFTRLTLVLPPDAEWSIDHQTRLVTLHISVGPHEFDVSQVFQRISKNRVAAISLAPGHAALLVKLNCDCAVDAFVHKKKLLVLDIKDPEPAIPKNELAAPEDGRTPLPYSHPPKLRYQISSNQ